MKRNIFHWLILTALLSTPLSAQKAMDGKDYQKKPVFFGLAKLQAQYEPEKESVIFAVRNARLGVYGAFAEKVGYLAQVDFSDQGSFKILDLAVRLMPFEQFNVTIGQMEIPYSIKKIYSPSQDVFVDRSLIKTYVLPATRDIGATFEYKWNNDVLPLLLQGGIYNGTGSNNPLWGNSPAYALRLALGDKNHVQVSANLANNFIIDNLRTDMYGINITLPITNFTIDVEGDIRRTKDTVLREEYGLNTQVTYLINLKSNKIHYLLPVLRWDAVTADRLTHGLDQSRLTFGLNFGLMETYQKLECRLNYEHTFYKEELQANTLVKDKIALELFLKF